MRWGAAGEAGFRPERLEWAWDVLRRAAGSPAVPAAVAAVGRHGIAVGPRAFGAAVFAPEAERAAAAPDTLFDLASLTKVVGTATAIWALVERGRLRLQEPVAAILPAFGQSQAGEDAAWRPAVTIAHLLAHSSGLPAGRNLRQVAGGREQRRAAVATTPLTAAPGQRAVYSDLGFILLGQIVGAVAGQDLDAFCRTVCFEPLGMTDSGWNPPPALAARAAATEWVEGAWAPGGLAGHLRGVVHDENARSLGGLAGHAGLFSTAADLAIFADTLRAGGLATIATGPVRLFSARTVAQLATPVTSSVGDSRTLGWQGVGTLRAPFGDLFSPRAFGHTGFTGTSLWIDPDCDLWMILLTNAVHMGRTVGLPALPALRAQFHNAVIAAIDDL